MTWQKKIRAVPELEDLPGFPYVLRSFQSGYLSALDKLIGLYVPVDSWLSERWSTVNQVLSLASGSGNSSLQCTHTLRKHRMKLLLTDKFPPDEHALPSLPPGVHYFMGSIDVVQPWPVADAYLMVNALHHFSPKALEPVLLEAAARGSSVLFIESLYPNFRTFLKVLLATTLGVLLLTPFIRPFRWWNVLLTYILPIGIVVTAYDGLLSVLKAYRHSDYGQLQHLLLRRGIQAECGKVEGGLTPLYYFYLPA